MAGGMRRFMQFRRGQLAPEIDQEKNQWGTGLSKYCYIEKDPSRNLLKTFIWVRA